MPRGTSSSRFLCLYWNALAGCCIRYAFFLPATQYDWILCRRQVCLLTFFHAAMEQKSGARGYVTRAPYNKKRVSSLYRTATTTYPCLIPHLGESVGAGRIRLTPAQKYEFFVSLQRKKELSAILSLFFESRMPKRLPGCVSEGGAGRVNE